MNLAGVTTVGGAVDAINAAAGGKATASIPAGSAGLTLTDASGGGGTLSVTENNGSTAAADLGLTARRHRRHDQRHAGPGRHRLDPAQQPRRRGRPDPGRPPHHRRRRDHPHGLPLVRHGRAGRWSTRSTPPPAGAVTASLNAAGTGVQLTDDTGGTGTLSTADADGTDSATALGLTGVAVDGTLSGKDPRSPVADRVHPAVEPERRPGRRRRHVHDHDGRRGDGDGDGRQQRHDRVAAALPDQQQGRGRADRKGERHRQRHRGRRRQWRGPAS